MKSLVTGASGFIGSHLVQSLVEDGEDVRCFVKHSSDTSFLEKFNVEIYEGNVKDLESLEKAFKGVDVIYHLAALAKIYAGIPQEEYNRVNVEGTENVLKAAKKNKVETVLYCSTIDAIGPSLDGKPVDESMKPHPINWYGKAKLRGEFKILKYFRNYGVDGRIVRPPMVYGPRNPLYAQRLFSTVNRGWYPVVGSGETMMEFCYVKNLVHGMKLIVKNGEPGEDYFISDKRAYQIKEIVKEIGRQLGKRVKIINVPVPIAYGIGISCELLCKLFRVPPFCVKETGRPAFSRNTVRWTKESVRICDISKAREELNYGPPYSLKEGIQETIRWHKKEGLL